MAANGADDFVLYLLMRKDMDSLNHTGKLIAQGAHAANHAAESISRNEFGPDAMMQFSKWQKQTTQGFGTTIVFGSVHSRYRHAGIALADIFRCVEHCHSAGFAAAVITDPTYPLQDGRTLHSFPCVTCGWVFGSREALKPILWPFELHPDGQTYQEII